MTTSGVPHYYCHGCRFRQKCTKFRQLAKIYGETGVGVVVAAALENHNAGRCAGRLVAGFWQCVSVFGLSVTINIIGNIIGDAIVSGVGKNSCWPCRVRVAICAWPRGESSQFANLFAAALATDGHRSGLMLTMAY